MATTKAPETKTHLQPQEWPIKVPQHVLSNITTAQLSAEMPGTKRPGQTGHYRSVTWFKEGKMLTIDSDPNYPRTSYDTFNIGMKRDPDANCLGHRAWDMAAGDYAQTITWESYRQIDQRRTFIGSALMHVADTIIKPQGHWAVGLWTVNRPEWQIVNQAINAYSLVSVSLYQTLGPNVVEYCIGHANVQIVFCAPQHIPTLLGMSKSTPMLKVIVCLDEWKVMDAKNGGPPVGALPKATALKAWAAEKGIHLFTFKEFETLGQTNLRPHIVPSPDAMCSIYYTSGSTGMPKGVVLSQRFMATTVIASVFGQIDTAPNDQEVQLSYLPLSHIYARFVEDVAFGCGSSLAYSTGDNLRLLEDFAIVKPTSIISVPRVLNRLYQAIAAKTINAPGIKGSLAKRAFEAKIANYRATGQITHALYDRLVMNKVKQVVGGRLRVICTGSAPIAPQVLEFLAVGFCVRFREGYGLTESGGCATANLPQDFNSVGKVGPVVPTVEVKLVDVPDLKYLSSDKPHPRGEFCMRGDNVFSQYYKDQAKTDEAIDSEGWFHTGDVASVDERGRFTIIDRVKNLIKLSQGEYVAVEKVENVYSAVGLGAQVFIYADSTKDYLILFVVPEPEPFAAFAGKVLGKTISPTDSKELVAASLEPKVTNAALAVYTKEAKARGLNGFETARQLAFRMTPFSVEEDTLTPTLKIKRNVANKLLKDRADKLFAERVSAGDGGFGKSKL